MMGTGEFLVLFAGFSVLVLLLIKRIGELSQRMDDIADTTAAEIARQLDNQNAADVTPGLRKLEALARAERAERSVPPTSDTGYDIPADGSSVSPEPEDRR